VTEDPEKIGANPEEMQSEVVYEEIPKEEAAVKPDRALKKQHRVQHLGAGCCGMLKERTQGNGEYQNKFAAARRGRVARHERHHHQGQGRDSIAAGTQKSPEKTDIQEEALGTFRMPQRIRNE
jgi:hypothetical protein